jgi:Mg2+/Co2+ transporter CorB
MTLGLTLAAVFFLLLVSAFFSGSETAMTAASRARMHALAEDGDRRAAAVLRLLESKDRLIGTILVGNNVVNIAASALATALFIGLVGEEGVVYATAVMTVLVVIFAEVLPKTYAIASPEATARNLVGPLRLIVFILSPLVAAMTIITRALLALTGRRAEGNLLTPHEEIRGAVDLAQREGMFEKMDADMLGGILDLDELTVVDVMVHRKSMMMLDADEPTAALIDAALESPHTRLPLWRDDPENIVGVLHAKDLLRALHRAGGAVEAVNIAAILREPWFVPETTSLREQLNNFREKREHFALVVDEYGALMGLLTLEDILEEIVGQIDDEHDVKAHGMRPQPDGSVRADGTVSIRDLNRAMDWKLPDEEAVTVAGLVIHEAQTIPEPGQIFSFHGYRFEVLRRQRNQITQLHIWPAPTEGDEDSG